MHCGETDIALFNQFAFIDFLVRLFFRRLTRCFRSGKGVTGQACFVITVDDGGHFTHR